MNHHTDPNLSRLLSSEFTSQVGPAWQGVKKRWQSYPFVGKQKDSWKQRCETVSACVLQGFNFLHFDSSFVHCSHCYVLLLHGSPKPKNKNKQQPRQDIKDQTCPSTLWLFFPKQLWSWMGFSIFSRNRLSSIIISGFRVGFRGLSPCSFWHSVPASFLVPGRVCLPTLLAFCSSIFSGSG